MNCSWCGADLAGNWRVDRHQYSHDVLDLAPDGSALRTTLAAGAYCSTGCLRDALPSAAEAITLDQQAKLVAMAEDLATRLAESDGTDPARDFLDGVANLLFRPLEQVRTCSRGDCDKPADPDLSTCHGHRDDEPF